MSTSTAIARIDKQPEVEKVPAKTSLPVPAALLLAAESVSAKSGGTRAELEGVFLHQKGDRGRVVGTSGDRLFVASFALPDKGDVPPWLKDGVILSGDSLRNRIALLGKLSGEQSVSVTYAKGDGSVELADKLGHTVFKVPVIASAYPDYDGALGAKSFANLDDDGQQSSREWQPVGINSGYLKQCGDIAKTLEAGLQKGERSKLGMVVRAYNGGDADAPLVFDFSTYPGAILVVAPAVMPNKATSHETAAILAPAVKGTVSALRAHATRWDVRAKEATDERDRVAATAKADEFRKRISAILALVPSGLALGNAKSAAAAAAVEAAAAAAAAVEAEAAAAAESAAAESRSAAAAAAEAAAEGERDDGPTFKPATKRTRIKVPGKHGASNGRAAA